MTIFDGNFQAEQKEIQLRQRIADLLRQPIIGAILFSEDAGSRLYTRLKKEAAERVGAGYSIHEFSINDPLDLVAESVHRLNLDPAVTGVIIQKPTKNVWLQAVEGGRGEEDANFGGEEFKTYNDWWSALTAMIDPEKDVDGLHPSTLAAIERGSWLEQGRVLPATAQAVVEILTNLCLEQPKNTLVDRVISQLEATQNKAIATQAVGQIDDPALLETSNLQRVVNCLSQKKVIILGKSDLLGKPLYYLLKSRGVSAEMMGSKELSKRIDQARKLLDADIVISATGRPGLITADLLKDGVAVIDVGEPKGDVDFASVKEKADFITPVPGGVGPMTVVCLLQNMVVLAEKA